MTRACFSLLLLAVAPGILAAQFQSGSQVASTQFFNMVVDPAPIDGGGGGGQVVPSGYGEKAFSRLSVGGSVSTIGTGGGISTNAPARIDLRVLGNLTNYTYNFNQSGFNIGLNLGLINAGAMADYYPWKSLRVSGGYLLLNNNRIRADLQAAQNATFTLNNVDYVSDNADPVRGVGRLVLSGSGFMVTTGWGKFLSHSHKHWTFPVEAGVTFINTPKVYFYLDGKVCTSQGVNCQNAASFPGFQSNLQAQLSSWQSDVSPYHIYPVFGGGVAYTFKFRN